MMPGNVNSKHYLVGGLEHLDYFSIQLGVSSSQLTFIFFRGVAHPPTRFYGRYNHFMGYCGNMGKIMGKLEIWGNEQSSDDAPGDLMKPRGVRLDEAAINDIPTGHDTLWETNITMENHHAINGQINDFDWAIFNSFLYVYQRVSPLSINYYPIIYQFVSLLPLFCWFNVHELSTEVSPHLSDAPRFFLFECFSLEYHLCDVVWSNTSFEVLKPLSSLV